MILHLDSGNIRHVRKNRTMQHDGRCLVTFEAVKIWISDVFADVDRGEWKKDVTFVYFYELI